jgi:hypothetical protein
MTNRITDATGFPPYVVDTNVGVFEVRESLGGAVNGPFHRGVHRVSGRSVALRFLLPPYQPIPAYCAMIENEYRSAALVDHPNSVRVIDFARTSAGPLIVMELLEGRDLRTIVNEDGPVPIGRACEIALLILGALARAHARGVAHGDVVAVHVVMVGERPVLIDYFKSRPSDRDTVAGDLYGVGSVLLEALAGESVLGTFFPPGLASILFADHLRDVRGITPALAAVITRALDKGYASADAMASELRAAYAEIEL